MRWAPQEARSRCVLCTNAKRQGSSIYTRLPLTPSIFNGARDFGLHGNEPPCCYVVAEEAALSSPATLKRKQRPARPPPAPLRRGFCGCQPSPQIHRSSRAAGSPGHVAAIVFDLRARWCQHVLAYRRQDRACRSWVAYRSRDRFGPLFGYRGGWGGPACYVSPILAPHVE